MRVRSNVRLAAGLVVASCRLTLWAQAPGAVAGFVLDEAGRPVAGAEVSAFPSNRPSVGMLPHSISGPDGSYLITGVSPGLYRIAAEKPREGYGNPIEVLFESRASLAPSAEVRPGETTDGVAVRLGPRGGWVSGAVKDAVTGATVLGSSVALLYAASSQEYGGRGLGRDGTFRLLLPSDKGVRLRFSARGYEVWYYGPDGTEAHATPLKMSPGETKQIVIRLRPLKGPPHSLKA